MCLKVENILFIYLVIQSVLFSLRRETAVKSGTVNGIDPAVPQGLGVTEISEPKQGICF